MDTLTRPTTEEMALRAALKDAQDQIRTLKKQLSGVLVEHVVEPATGEVDGRDADDLHQDVLTVIAECLMDDLDGGLRPDELTGRAVKHLSDGVGR